MDERICEKCESAYKTSIVTLCAECGLKSVQEVKECPEGKTDGSE